ncbi:4'-phosphopantetheinyl transferase [Rhizobium altiplani]|uniref:Enterobactin synthase component D n=3 Tax=Rhizobium/Agrobacterium group TaxID=227290 RepID=K0Q488_9HYPH|nr:4'-phosphopantetheinyl transferase [Rhizobium altiplani]CCM79905.1 putative 4'-phosphopantetheinyl transferase (Enterobactin synthetase-like, component D) [Rhizobium mesoamericanum STM3625]
MRGNLMLEKLLPPNVAVQTSRANDGPEIQVMAEEESAIATAVKGRRREFSIGRACARAALCKLGFPSCPVPSGPNREPLWPSGIVGSITHCVGFCAAAVAMKKDFIALGIDAEVDADLPSGVLSLISRDEERHWIANASGHVNWGRLLFSAKESIFKAWFPLTREWLDFEDALVTIIPDDGSFIAQLPHTCVPAKDCPWELRGRFTISNGLILTAVMLDGPQSMDESVAVEMAAADGVDPG